MEAHLKVLNAGARLRLNEGACLPLRSEFGRCRACAQACPAAVLAVTVERVSLADGCLHCGRCAAACPTEALRFDALEFEPPLPAGTAPVEVECMKVPVAARAVGAIAVPCLGGLSAGRIAALHEAAGERGVVLVDRGWCGQCAAGCRVDAHPADAALAEAAAWLQAVDDPRPAPVRVARPLPPAQMPAAIALPPLPADEGPAMSRRQFFRSVTADPVGQRRRAMPMGGDGRAAFPAAARRESPERRRLLDAVAAAAARAGRELPGELLPRVVATTACIDHRVCTAACPTGALRVVDTADGATLSLTSAACIGCGACARACPEGALQVQRHGGERGAVAVATHRRRECSQCGDGFTPRAQETLCLACSKSQRFMGDAMAQLFGTRN